MKIWGRSLRHRRFGTSWGQDSSRARMCGYDGIGGRITPDRPASPPAARCVPDTPGPLRDSQPLVKQVEQPPRVAVLPTAASLIHDVAPADSSVGVGEGQRSAAAEVTEGARVGSERALGHRHLETGGEPRRPAEDAVDAIDLFG